MSTSYAQKGMTRGATISAGLHVLILLSLVLVIPHQPPPPPPPDDTMEVEFDGTAAAAQKSQDHGKVAAVAEAEKPATEAPALVAPKDKPLEIAPPPPPPPPPPAQAQASQVQTLNPERIPPPPPDKEAIALKPPPPMKVAATPPPPKIVPTQTPVKKVIPDPTAAKPLDSVRHQQNQTKNPAVDTHSLMNTLDKLLADQKQTAPPTHAYNPSRNGARNAGGQVHGSDKGDLTQAQAKTIGASVKKCFSSEVESKEYATYSVMLEVVVDGSGEVREAHLAPEAVAQAARDPAYLAFTDAALHAVQDPQCSKLPLPASQLGKPGQTYQFRFRPV